MFLIYIDEAGDDGFPGSSKIFLNTAVKIYSRNWNIIEKKIETFRIELANTSKIPTNFEFHTNNMIFKKEPYTALLMTDIEIMDVLRKYAEFISKLNISCTTTVVDKTKIIPTKNIVKVFNYGVNHLVNRINTTIAVKYKQFPPDAKYYMLFCDEGRINNWENLIKEMRTNNKLFDNTSLKKKHFKLNKLVEKPIQRDSKNSNLLQVADFVATIVYKYYQINYHNTTFRNRGTFITRDFIDEILNIIKPIINFDASKTNPYGIVIFPK